MFLLIKFFKHLHKRWVIRVVRLSAFSVLFLYSSLVVSSTTAWADSFYGSGNYGSCSYGSCGITLSSNGSVTLGVRPGSSTTCTIQNDSVSVTTDDSNGYTLTMQDSVNDSSLINGSNSIATSSGTASSPSTLSSNSWGYRVDDVGGFGAGPTTAQSNISPPSTTFAGMPNSAQNPDTISTTSVAANPAVVTPVWYGVCVNNAIPPRSYTTQVIYTAVTN